MDFATVRSLLAYCWTACSRKHYLDRNEWLVLAVSLVPLGRKSTGKTSITQTTFAVRFVLEFLRCRQTLRVLLCCEAFSVFGHNPGPCVYHQSLACQSNPSLPNRFADELQKSVRQSLLPLSSTFDTSDRYIFPEPQSKVPINDCYVRSQTTSLVAPSAMTLVKDKLERACRGISCDFIWYPMCLEGLRKTTRTSE